jgi:hypothetical protein
MDENLHAVKFSVRFNTLRMAPDSAEFGGKGTGNAGWNLKPAQRMMQDLRRVHFC